MILPKYQMQKSNSQSKINKKHLRLNTLESQLIPKITKKRAYSFRVQTNPSLNEKLSSNINSNQPIIIEQQSIQLEKLRNKSLKQLPPLPLLPTKQYETKLMISAQKWMVYSYQTKCYKRGWKPSQIGQFSGLLRLLIFKVYTLLCEHDSQIPLFSVRINTACLRQQIALQKMRKDKKLSPQKRPVILIENAINRGLQNNMIITMADLIYGLLMTNFDDIIDYAIINVGYFCYCFINNITISSNHHSNNSHFYITKISQSKQYVECFEKYLKQIVFPNYKMSSSAFNSYNLSFTSTLNDVCTLFLTIQTEKLFQQITGLAEYQAKIKYQLGYNFWQSRNLVWKNKRPVILLKQSSTSTNTNIYGFISNWRSLRNFSSIVINKQLNILIILQQCKFGMLQRDVKIIQNWILNMKKPIVNVNEQQRKAANLGYKINKNKLLPLLRITDQPAVKNIKNDGYLKRANTQI